MSAFSFARMFFVVMFFAVILVTAAGAVFAQNAETKIIRSMTTLDPVTLQAGDQQVRLWGIKGTQDSALDLGALDLMDGLLGTAPVNCRVLGGGSERLIAKCNTESGTDIAVALLQNGYAVIDRFQTYNSAFAEAYAVAQNQARDNGRGVWRQVRDNEGGWRGLIDQLMPFMTVLWPFVGFILVAWIANRQLGLISKTNAQEYESARRKEASLEERERLVVASLLESELEGNRAKVEAFLTIYREMLAGMENAEILPKYQQGGDLLHQHPALSRLVFESNIDRLSLLDLKLAGDVSRLYAGIYSSPDYIMLNPTMSLETATKMVQDVIGGGEELIVQIGDVLSQLRAISAHRHSSPAGDGS